MTVILYHSLLSLNIRLTGNQTECLLDIDITYSFASGPLCSNQGIEVVINFQLDVRLFNKQTICVVRMCQSLVELGPFKIILRFYVFDTDVTIIL